MDLALSDRSTPRSAPSRVWHTSVNCFVACAVVLCAMPAAAQTGTQRIRLIPGQGSASGGAIRRATPAVPAAQSAPSARAEAPVVAKQPEAPKVLDAAIVARVAELLERATAAGLTSATGATLIEAASGGVYADCARAHGDLALLDTHLADVIAASEGARRAAALRLSGLLTWRHGDLARALADFEALRKSDGADLDARLAEARLLDALGRSKEALAAYEELVPLLADEDLATRLRVRMALMSMESRDVAQKELQESALATFAREEGQPVELRNRAAVVLALLGRPGDAADLYVVADAQPQPVQAAAGAATDDVAADPEDEALLDADAVKRALKSAAHGELRVAEWALAAKDFPRAQGAAWRAVHLAPVARERRYGLTLLAEAHRGDGTLPALLERFAAEQTTLPAEARRMWIELLRETGSYDAAIEMSSGAGAVRFSRDERRRLLELFREAGRTDLMLAEYSASLASEPLELTWREGLARHFLEQGDRAAAIALWEEWFTLAEGPDGSRADTLLAARSLGALGLDELAERGAELAFEARREPEAALLFLFDLYLDRGRQDDARAVLARLDTFAAPGSPVRMQISDGLERIGDLEGAVRALEGVRVARGVGEVGEDLELRLAWLYSEVGREERALELWRELWTRVKSQARLRFVEDRMMTVASRIGVLADVAVELEQKLYSGSADQKDSGLLVRLYTKVGDAVSAAEVVDEFLRHTGGSELEALTEKARIYLSCNDYFHYEKAVARLMTIDPEGRPDYLRQLAMSQLERGKPDEARTTLLQLGELPGGDDSAAEFEAGVLALSGLREDAIAAYRRGLASHPERIDSYLLMANLMKEVRQSDRAVGMFQFLAEHADGDDAFTIAIDGLLNMLVDAPPRPKMVEWARRITLERLAAREDAPYLYQLLADLAGETNDQTGQIVALANSLAPAGPRRSSILRELMELTKPAPRGFDAAARKGDRKAQLAFGRRLVGLGDMVPPEVFLDLGDAFLEDGDEGSASRTFDLTREFPDGELYQRQAAERFEKANFVERALDRYQAVLAASPTDVPLLAKVGELREALGDDAGAHELYRRAYDVLVRRKPLVLAAVKKEDEGPRYFARNVDDFDQHRVRVVEGILATAESDEAVRAFVLQELAALEAELGAARAELAAARAVAAPTDGAATEPPKAALLQHPRLAARVDVVRPIVLATASNDLLERLDGFVLASFPDDDDTLRAAVDGRVRWGRFGGARQLVLASGRTGEERAALLARIGDDESVEASANGPMPLAQAVAGIVPALAAGDQELARTLVRRADLGTVAKEDTGSIGVLFNAARFIGDQELALRVGRDWVRLELGHSTYPYQLEQLVESLLSGLDGETGLALARYLVGRVLEDPEKNAQTVTILPKLARRFDESVVDAEQVRTLLDGFGDKYAWGLGPVLALLPPAERAGAVRSVWGKLEAANRAGFLIDLVVDSAEEVPAELGAFVRESLVGALGEADDYVRYRIAGLLDLEHSHELALALARDIEGARPELTFLPAVRAIHAHALGLESALADGAAAWAALIGVEDDDYTYTRARQKLQQELLPAGRMAFEAALAARQAEGGSSPELARARVALCVAAEDDAAAMVALDEGLEAHTDDLDLLRMRREVLQRRGERIAAAEALEKLAAASKDDAEKKRHARTLVSEWKALHAPERALAAQQELDPEGAAGEDSGIPGLPAGFVLPAGAVIVVGGVVYSGDDVSASQRKALPRTFKEALEKLEAGEVRDGALVLRRMWRQFPVGQPNRGFAFGRRYRGLPLATLTLPAPKVEVGADGAPVPAKEASRGGLLAYDPKPPETRPAAEKAHKKVVGWAEAKSELERFLRTVESYELDRLQDLLDGLLAAEIDARGRDVVFGELLARVADGSGGRADQIQLLGLLDSAPELLDERAATALADMVRTIPPRDAAQVRRLARVKVRGGAVDDALRLYRWCALQGTRVVQFGEETGEVVTTVSSHELVREAREHLTGEARIELIELVLEASRPIDRPWEEENYGQLVLDTWSEVLPPVEALARARQVCEDASDPARTGLRRRVARGAAALYLAAGETENALRALEVGVAKLDPAEVRLPEETWYRQDPTISERLSIVDLRKLLPVVSADMDEAERARLAAWFGSFAGALEGWLAEERVELNGTVEALALAAVRLFEIGQVEEARALAQRLAARAATSAKGLAPNTMLWTIDALRAVGDEAAARSAERVLLAEGRLHPERVADVLVWVLADEGPAAALAAAQPVSDVMRQPRLVELLATAAESAGQPEAAAGWRAAGEAARAAETALEEAAAKKS
jgi:hypothetical protein